MNKLSELLLKIELETPAVLKAANRAESKLGELKGTMGIIPNKAILLHTLPLQEAKTSSEIENIVSTNDDLFRSKLDLAVNGTAKEVRAHDDALIEGFRKIKADNLLRLQDILNVKQTLLKNNAGIRTTSGTVLVNNAGETIYTPPSPEKLPDLMKDLITFINDDKLGNFNPLVKMAIIHHQFESIHPFYDGNGRTGRIINILYLVLVGRLDLPVLYMSHYILNTKEKYYRLLQEVRDENVWEEWIIYMLDGIYQTSVNTIALIKNMHKLMQEFKHKLRKTHPRHYSQDLINSLFKHPYTKVAFVQEDLGCSYLTARNKLKLLAENGYLSEIKKGRSNYYVNDRLVECLLTTHDKQ